MEGRHVALGLGEAGTQRHVQCLQPHICGPATTCHQGCCVADASPFCQLWHRHSPSILSPCFGLAGTRAVSTTGHTRKQDPCSQGSTAAPGSSRGVGMGGCRPCCLQVLTQALAGSGIKGVEAWVAVAGVGPRGVGAELAAIVQALGTLVDV